jgi:hypothetical protein
MNKEIEEEYLDTHPILTWLSVEPIPVTDCPLQVARTLSTMSGTIVGERRLLLNSSSWLCTDDIQFLFAFHLMCNPENNPGFFHVIGLVAITQQITW